MFIPSWIIIGTILALYYFFRIKNPVASPGVLISPIEKDENRNVVGINNNREESAVNKKSKEFSYRLSISMEPTWDLIYKKILNPKSEEEWIENIEGKKNELEKPNLNSGRLYGRRYSFIEYYDSATGLTSRFQNSSDKDETKKYYSPVEEFGQKGFVFDSDSDKRMNLKIGEKNYREKLEKLESLTVEINEDSIYNEIFEKNIGGPRLLYEKKNRLFKFPLFEVFNFLIKLGLRFHEAEKNVIIKWPDSIQEKLNKSGIKYALLPRNYIFKDVEIEVFNLEENDKEFYLSNGLPKIGLSDTHRGYFGSKLCHYSLRVEIFRPGENERIETVSYGT